MTTTPKARKFRIRRSGSLTSGGRPAAPETPASETPASDAGPAARTPASEAPSEPSRHEADARATAPKAQEQTPTASDATSGDIPEAASAEELEAIRKEGLTGRQLRMARRAAQKHGLDVASDYDAVQKLRGIGVDPFQRTNLLELVAPERGGPAEGSGAEGSKDTGAERARPAGSGLPQAVPQGTRNLPSTERMSPAERRAIEVGKIQKDMARRRRRKAALLMTRLFTFVGLPTFAVGWYFYVIATPMYATHSTFVIQQAESAAAAGLGGLFQGTSMATQQDSITVQSYLQSRAALVRLNEEFGYADHFSQDFVDPLQRLAPDATMEATYKLYSDHVKISYDPTEGIVQLEVVALDPETSQMFSEALIDYAEEQVDHLTQRLRADQMAGAQASYDAAEARRAEALAALLAIQQDLQQIDPAGETSARTQQISVLESQRQQLQLDLNARLSVSRPNEAQVESLRNQIQGIENLIANLRAEMTTAEEGAASLAAMNTALRQAEENYTFQTALVQQALSQMEAAQIEANRQVRYLSLGVEPIAPDEATYPRAFESTLVAFVVFCGIYLMLSITASVLREQVSS